MSSLRLVVSLMTHFFFDGLLHLFGALRVKAFDFARDKTLQKAERLHRLLTRQPPDENIGQFQCVSIHVEPS